MFSIIYCLYPLGIICCMLRVVVRIMVRPPLPVVHNSPEARQSRRDLLILDSTISLIPVMWTMSFGFTIAALQNTLNINSAFQVVWISSTMVIRLAKVYQLLYLQHLVQKFDQIFALAVVLIIQTYLISLLTFSMFCLLCYGTQPMVLN